MTTWTYSTLHAETFYWCTTLGEEVDFVIEVGESLLPIQVKSSGGIPVHA